VPAPWTPDYQSQAAATPTAPLTIRATGTELPLPPGVQIRFQAALGFD
jgi:hypothetical protein